MFDHIVNHMIKALTGINMCYTHKLCETNHGEVSASCCGTCIKIEYTNVVMIHNYEGVKHFYDGVDQCIQEVKSDTSGNTDETVFAIQAKSMFLKFTQKEIHELHYLLESALIDYHQDLTRFVENEPCDN